MKLQRAAKSRLIWLEIYQHPYNDRETTRQVGLYPNSRKRVGKCLPGMKQRLGIAQALMEKPVRML